MFSREETISFIESQGKSITKDKIQHHIVDQVVENTSGTTEDKVILKNTLNYYIDGVEKSAATLSDFKKQMNEFSTAYEYDLSKVNLNSIYSVAKSISAVGEAGETFRNSNFDNPDKYNKNLNDFADSMLGSMQSTLNVAPVIGTLYSGALTTVENSLDNLTAAVNSRNARYAEIAEQYGLALEFTTWGGELVNLSKLSKNDRKEIEAKKQAADIIGQYFNFNLSETQYDSIINNLSEDEKVAFKNLANAMAAAGYSVSYQDIIKILAVNPEKVNDIIAAAQNKRPIDPLVLDLGPTGIDLVSAHDGVYFNMDKVGLVEKTGWITPEDGFLAIDRDQDGLINDSNELFSDGILLSNGGSSKNGFEVLADLDSNNDGVIDAKDDSFSQLLVCKMPIVMVSLLLTK